MMIFVAVGTQLPFDRLIEAIDDWAAQNPQHKVMAQTGSGTYQPKHIEAHTGFAPDAFRDLCAQSDVIVSHAGIGTMLLALELGKPLLIMPRRAAYGEHRDDHQLSTVNHLSGKTGITVARDEYELPTALDRLLQQAQSSSTGGISPHASPELLAAVREFIFV